MATIPDDLIREAATWLASQRQEPPGFELTFGRNIIFQIYFDESYKLLKRMAAEYEHGDNDRIGACVRHRDPHGNAGVATAYVTTKYVLGYLPGDETPSFSWPSEVRERMLVKRKVSQA